ncbi:MAG: hypothetical protein JO284_18475 [Planctomycetaceae bacterium]|nr:hypothetical protein [Planctomycetaceae bacterium]MBV8609879.1 hypothetical protein [Singulisphaera sp.]MBV8232083.1 hypothetical protein [Planctomycetaceae bacterium]MBV8270281.1 hypothetical protein [Planctomycetaceae bacterium]MBV8316319.1 hypothetical protein [Planctomycetaceae bacterium]
MFDQVLDSFRKISESTIQMQQEFYKQWMSQWPAATMMGPASAGGGVTEQAQSLQRRWMDSITELMNKQREVLDAQYRTGIQAIQDAFRVTEAKSPEEYCRLTEDLWRKAFDTLKSTAEAQMRDYQSAVTKWLEMVSKRS